MILAFPLHTKAGSSLRELTACSSVTAKPGLPWAPCPKLLPENEWEGVLRSPQDIPEYCREGADSQSGWRPPAPRDRVPINCFSGCSACQLSILPVVQRVLAAHLAVCLRGFEPSPRGEPAFRHSGGQASGRAA